MDSDRLQHLYLTGVTPNGKDIGVGAYGRVFEVELCGTIFAAKEIHSILVQGVRREEFEVTRKAFLTECIQSSTLGHPNVVQVLGVYNPGGQSLLPVLVMERMQESLTSVVEKYPNIPMYVKLSMLLDVSQGLWYLHVHQPPIIHRDLSPNNVLLTSQFVAKISDLGVAKVIQADSKKTKTRAPGTVDFMPPEALLESPEYGPSLDVFSYGGVILHVVNQEWPSPLHYVMIDPKTRKPVALSETRRRQEHIDKMSGAPADLESLVTQCLDDDSAVRPPISDVSGRVKRMKEVESVRCPHVNMNPITWQQVEQTTNTLRDVTITAQIDKQSVVESQVDIFKKTIKWGELAPLPLCRSAHTAVLLGGDVYVGGGFEGRSDSERNNCYRLDVYNLMTNQWSSSPITTPYCAFGMTAMDDKLVTAGGATKNDELIKKVLVLDAGQWKVHSEMPTARCNATAVGYHSSLIVVGGTMITESGLSILSIAELFDPKTESWYKCNNLPSPSRQLKSTILNNILYLLGGSDENGDASPRVYSVFLDTLSTHQLNWQTVPNTPWCYSAPVVFYNNLLGIGGRALSDRTSQTSEVYTLNPSTGQWKHLTNIPMERSFLAAVGVGDKIIVMGGATKKKKEYSNTVWIGQSV